MAVELFIIKLIAVVVMLFFFFYYYNFVVAEELSNNYCNLRLFLSSPSLVAPAEIISSCYLYFD